MEQWSNGAIKPFSPFRILLSPSNLARRCVYSSTLECCVPAYPCLRGASSRSSSSNKHKPGSRESRLFPLFPMPLASHPVFPALGSWQVSCKPSQGPSKAKDPRHKTQDPQDSPRCAGGTRLTRQTPRLAGRHLPYFPCQPPCTARPFTMPIATIVDGMRSRPLLHCDSDTVLCTLRTLPNPPFPAAASVLAEDLKDLED